MAPPAKLPLLVVDDEPSLRQMLAILFRREGFDVVAAAGASAAVEAIERAAAPFPVVLTDLAMPDGTGLDVLAAAKGRDPSTEVVLITAHSSIENAIAAMRSGAYDFVTKPFVPTELAALVQKALEKRSLVMENARLRAQVGSLADPSIVARSPAMRAVLDLAARVAPARATVLITGESGTGKERIARFLHEQSDRASRPFLVVNCGALPEALMESELFGHEKGAFTGAQGRHSGIFRDADGGTVLLDEVGELPAALQVKLLRVLQERRVRPVGASQEQPVDVRVLAATNRDVEADVAAGRFRQDLYYRLNVIRLDLPPLRARREDIAALTERFLRKLGAEMGKAVSAVSPEALRLLEAHDFPGNVRELENLVERAVALSTGSTIGVADLPPTLRAAPVGAPIGATELPAEGLDLDALLAAVERGLLVQALERTGGQRTAAARLLGVTFRSLRYRLQKHGLGADDGEAGAEGEGPEASASTAADSAGREGGC